MAKEWTAGRSGGFHGGALPPYPPVRRKFPTRLRREVSGAGCRVLPTFRHPAWLPPCLGWLPGA